MALAIIRGAVAAVALAASAQAQVITTDELSRCLATVNTRTSECLRYARGVVDGLVRARAQWGGATWFCMPEGDPFGTIIGDFARWYAANPRAGDLPASMVIQLAVVERFPCKF